MTTSAHWTRATGSEAETEALLASLHTLEIQHAEWQRQLRAGLRPHQNELAELDPRTKLFRVFESTVIPGLLQTAEYARARFAEGITVFKHPNDIDEAVRPRMQRQEMLYRPDKRFHFVLTEAALRYRLLLRPTSCSASSTGWSPLGAAERQAWHYRV